MRDQLPVMRNMHVGAIVALLLTILFVLIIPWLAIWGAFGGANQLMAGLALLLIALWLKSEGRKNAWALYPAFFMIVTDLAALLYIAYTNFFVKLPKAASIQASLAAILVGAIALVLVVAAAILIVDGWKALQAPRKEEAAEAA